MKFNAITKVGNVLKNKNARAVLTLKKNSPEILLGTGIISIVAGTVMACKTTLKVQEYREDNKDIIDEIHECHENVEKSEYSNNDFRKDLTIQYTKSSVHYLREFAPAIVLTGIGISCVIGSHNIMKKRNTVLMASYTALDTAFKGYRKRVTEELGEKAEKELRYNIQKQKTVNEDGEEVTNDVIDSNALSQYSRWWNRSSSSQWTANASYNKMFIQGQQNHLNDLLQVRGHVFLNEAYDALGLERSQAGSIVGWVKDHGDSFVDFDIFNGTAKSMEFINEEIDSVLLDFNVDGVIYDLI